MSKRVVVQVLLLLLVFSQAFSQSGVDSLSQAADSILNKQLIETAAQLKESRQKQFSDSLIKANLQKELELLKSSEGVKRKELQEKIRQIELEDSLRIVEQKRKIQELKNTNKGFPVSLQGDTLFFIFNRLGPFTPQERALRINKSLEKLYASSSYDVSLLRAAESESTFDVLYDNLIIMSITDMDALWDETAKSELADRYREKINGAILRAKEKNSLRNILIKIAEVVLVFLGIWLLIHFLNKLFRYSKGFITTRLTARIRSVQIKDYELLSDVQILQTVLRLHSVIRIFVIVLSLYLALPLLFSIFPTTEAWADHLIDLILSPVKKILFSIVDYLPNLFTIAVIFVAIRYLIKLVGFFAREVEEGKLKINGFYREWAQPTFNIIRFLLYVFMFIVIFPYLPGSDSPIFKGVSVFLGILFSLGSSSAISNAVAGLVITYMRPFKVGDRIKINDIIGDVAEKTLLVTRIRTTKNEEITIPNSSILSGHTINYTTSSQELGLIIYTTVTIGYDVPWKEVQQALIDAALRVPQVLKIPAPFVLQTSLDDFYVSYQLNAYINEVNKQARIYSDLHQNIQDVFNERGIEILSPHYKALRDGNSTTIPENYLPENYKAPHFRMKEEASDPER